MMNLTQAAVAAATTETLAGIDPAYRAALLAETTTAAATRTIRDNVHLADLMQDIAARRRYPTNSP